MSTGNSNGSGAMSATRSSADSGRRVVCERHGGGEMYISRTHTNPFRRFIRCPERKRCGCDFFQWVDDELQPHYLSAVQQMKMKLESLERQLQCKTMLAEVLCEKIRVRDAELESRRSSKSTTSMGLIAATREQWPFLVIGSLVGLCIAIMVRGISMAYST